MPLLLPIAQPIAPTYLEAYPAMTMVGMRNAWAVGQRERQWLNEHEELVARLEMLDWTSTEADFCASGSSMESARVSATLSSITIDPRRPTAGRL